MTTREQATLYLLGGGLLLASLIWANVRRACRNLVGALSSPKVLVPMLVFVALVVGATVLAARLDYWDPTLIGAVLLWTLFTGFRLLLNVDKIGSQPHFLRKQMVETVSFGAAYELFLNIRTFSLWVELLLVSGATVLAGLQAAAAQKAEYKQVATFLRVVSLGLAIWLIGATVHNLISHREEIELHDVVALSLVPIWLTLVSLPFFYLLALYSGYELLFVRMSFGRDDEAPAPIRNRLAVVRELGARVQQISQFPGHVAWKAGRANSFAETRRVLQEARAQEQNAADQKVAAAQRLLDNAGVVGTDDEGHELDQRQFRETTDALRWLWTCQVGWYQREGDGGHYRADILRILDNDFSRQGLPANHGITVRTSSDGQAWYAYRQTITGRVFAIGASEAPPSQWLYDGLEPPRDFPGRDAVWGNSMFELNDLNWWV